MSACPVVPTVEAIALARLIYKDQGVIPTQNYTRYSLRGSFQSGCGKIFPASDW